MTTDHQRRQPAGAPTGGQFAAAARTETGVHLGTDAVTPAWHPTGAGLTPGIGKAPARRIGQSPVDPRAAALDRAGIAAAMGAGARAASVPTQRPAADDDPTWSPRTIHPTSSSQAHRRRWWPFNR